MIIFQEVSKSFGDQSFAVKDISFEIEPGELVFITGASGSGKTTLMRLLTKEYTPTAGEILFENTPLSKIGAGRVHEHRRRIGVVFQDYRLLPELNVWENVALPLYVIGKREQEVEDRVTDLLKLVQLTEKATLFPSQLSGGEAQRISIARALAIGPEVIFADEPTGNLDPDTADHIAHLLLKINELGTTVLFATHDRRLLEHVQAHRHMHLENGELLLNTALRSKSHEKSSDPTDSTDSKKSTQKRQSTDAEDQSPPKKPQSAKGKPAKGKSEKPPVPPELEPQTLDSQQQPAVQKPQRKKKAPGQPFWKKIFGKTTQKAQKQTSPRTKARGDSGATAQEKQPQTSTEDLE